MKKGKNFNPWKEYEREKRKLQSLGLPPKEYERRLQELADRLGV